MKKTLFILLVIFFYWIFLIEDINFYKLKYNLTGKFDNSIIEILKNEEKSNKIFKLNGGGHNFSYPFAHCLRKLNLEKELNKNNVGKKSGTFYVLSYKEQTLKIMEFIVSREFDSPAKFNLDKHLNSYKYLINFISLYNKRYNTNIRFELLPDFKVEKTWRINKSFTALLKLIFIPLILYVIIFLFKIFCIKNNKNKTGDTDA